MNWLIWNHERGQYWKPAQRGYTEVLAEAGRYSFEEAQAICVKANEFVEPPYAPEESMLPDFSK